MEGFIVPFSADIGSDMFALVNEIGAELICFVICRNFFSNSLPFHFCFQTTQFFFLSSSLFCYKLLNIAKSSPHIVLNRVQLLQDKTVKASQQRGLIKTDKNCLKESKGVALNLIVKIFKLTKVTPTKSFQLGKISQGKETKIMALP